MLAICVEASHQRGLGHLFRALALVRALADRGAAAMVYVNEYEPALRMLRDRAIRHRTVQLNEAGSDWEAERIRDDAIRVWVDDRLDTDAAHAQRVRAAGTRLASFDNRGSGAALSDLNILAFPASEEETRIGRRVLAGMDYLVLDPALARHRRRRHALGTMVVTMGGSDTYGLTIEVLRALRERRLSATVVLGPGFAHERELSELLDDGFVVRRAPPSLAEEFARHDLAITAGGLTPCEANAAGLPALIIATEPWEARVGETLAKRGGAIYLGLRRHIDFTPLDRLIDISKMSEAALASVPADGAGRVADALLSLDR